MHKIVKSRHKRTPIATTGMSKATKEALKRQFEKDKSPRQSLSGEMKVTLIYTVVFVVVGGVCWFYWG